MDLCNHACKGRLQSSLQLLVCLITETGNSNPLTPELAQTLTEHGEGNQYIPCATPAELFATAAHQKISILKEKLYLGHLSARREMRGRKV